HDIDNLSYEEIQDQTGLNAVNIRVALSRARKSIRDRLQGL
ncbi:MAG: sigma factor-like helix-turn-helix DNA-binding protein, partial [Prevotella sp.]|nr:sigma factor-like helix-turn-helix DNA-binding protein [Prevotella sp.]